MTKERMIKDSQRHKNLQADGFRPNYVESYDMATQSHLDNIEMETQNHDA